MKLVKSSFPCGFKLNYDVPLQIIEGERYPQTRHGAKSFAVFGGAPRGKTISVLGLTFKPNTDDV